jgi:hypothetical protein
MDTIEKVFNEANYCVTTKWIVNWRCTNLFFLENNPSSYIIFNQGGIDKRVVKEWDDNFLFNSSVIVIIIMSLTYFILRIIEKKRN